MHLHWPLGALSFPPHQLEDAGVNACELAIGGAVRLVILSLPVQDVLEEADLLHGATNEADSLRDAFTHRLTLLEAS